MAKLSFAITGQTMSLTQELAIADTDAPRIMGYLLASPYGSVTENVQSEVPDPNWVAGESQTEADRPTITVQEWVTRPATPEETASNYANAILSQLLADTVAHEKAQAAAAAANSVAPIEVVSA